MGTDTPLAVLSDRPKLLYDYFQQLFAQVTNPPIDSIREAIITSPVTTIGSERNLLNPEPESCRLIELKTPVIGNADLAKLQDIQNPHFSSVTLPMVFDPKANIRTLLAVLWVCHFILWIFGDMFSLLQEMTEPATDTAVLFVAPSTAIVLTLMVVFCLVGRPTQVRLANLIVAPIYLLFNVGFFVDATEGWEYYIGVFYVLFILLIIWRAYAWPREA